MGDGKVSALGASESGCAQHVLLGPEKSALGPCRMDYLPPWGFSSASLPDAASILHLSQTSARSEKWYYYRHHADRETGAQSRCGA